MAIFLETPLKIALVGLALFAVPEIVDLLRRNRAIAGGAKLGLGWGKGFMDWWHNRFISLWNAFVGVIVGIVPGLGGSVVDWIAYGQTKAIVAARGGDTSQFGKGDIRGVIGPESANNAKEGGGWSPPYCLVCQVQDPWLFSLVSWVFLVWIQAAPCSNPSL